MAWMTNQGGQGRWWAGSGLDPVRKITSENDKDYYTDIDPRAYWGQIGQLFSGGNSAFEDFWNRNYDRYMQQYLRDVESGEGQNISFPDWVTGAKGNEISAQFQLQAPQARGIDRRLYDPGRFDTSY